jgi:hypothetical protein
LLVITTKEGRGYI